MLLLAPLGCPVPGDLDGDGHPAGLDCNDADPSVFPGAGEACNDVDDDCDGGVDANESNSTPNARITTSGGWAGYLGTGVQVLGDVTGNGHPDLAIAAGYSGDTGGYVGLAATVKRGSWDGALLIEGPLGVGYNARFVDYDGDDNPDVMVDDKSTTVLRFFEGSLC
jgi:hypothetical protein